MEYLRRAVNLSQKSFDAGEFPAGAVLVTKGGTVYESSPSLPYNHGEMMVLDAAIKNEGFPLTGAMLYASMQPCLMCTSKIYWAGLTTVHYVIPKSKTNQTYAYENTMDTVEVARSFFKPVTFIHEPTHLLEALSIYERWIRAVEKKN
jgi:guanine deaminase